MNAPANDLAMSAGVVHRRVEGAIRSTQQAAHQTVDQLAGGAERLAANVDLQAQRGAEALRDRVDQLRERARRTAEGASAQIRQDPLQALLIVGAIGAALGALLALLGRGRP